MSDNKCLKPPKMMKLKRRKFGATQRSQCDPYVKQKKPEVAEYCHGDEICKRQLMNPFQSSRKTTNLLEITDKNDTNQPDNIFNMILNKPTASQMTRNEVDYVLPETPTNRSEKGAPDRSFITTVPRDWSVKLEYKLLSTKPFKWCAPSLLKLGEEARCTALCAANQQPEECSDRGKLRYYLSYWIHPNIPWIKLFPRDRPSVSKSDSTVLKQEALAGLQNDWSASFESLFGLLKSGHCPYFYVCSHQTTVLFRSKEGIFTADMVPTTYGVRNALKQEDIEFTMPLAQELFNAETLEQENLDSNEDTGDARDFLDSLGIDSNRYRELDPSIVKIREAGRLKLDHSIRSLVRVKGSQVQGVFNYLLNNKSLTPTVGELAGVPPTLLSPSVFVGGTIRHNQVKCGSSHTRQEDGGMELVHYLHLSGPLLPSSVEGINTLLSCTQGEFTGKFESLQNSTAYNSHDQPSCGNLDNAKSNPDNSTENAHLENQATPTEKNLGHSSGVGGDGISEETLKLSSESSSKLHDSTTVHEIRFKDRIFSIK